MHLHELTREYEHSAATLRTPPERDLFDAIVSHAAGLAALRRHDADIAEIARANADLAHDLDAGGGGVGADRRFHRAVLGAARSPVLVAVLDGLTAAADAHPQLAAHRLIFEAIVHGERDEAAWLMLEHVRIEGVLAPA